MSAIQNLTKKSGQKTTPQKNGVVKGGSAISRLASTPRPQAYHQQNTNLSQGLSFSKPQPQQSHPILDFINNLAKGAASVPVKAALSLKELPTDAMGKYGTNEQKGYNIPWLGNTKSYTTDILNTQNDVIQGQKPMSAMVGAIAKPVVDLGSFAVGGGAVKGAALGKQALLKSLGEGGAIAALTQGSESLSQGSGAGKASLDALKAVPAGIATAGVLHGGAKVVGAIGKLGQKIESKPSAIESLIKSQEAPVGTTIVPKVSKIETPIQNTLAEHQQNLSAIDKEFGAKRDALMKKASEANTVEEQHSLLQQASKVQEDMMAKKELLYNQTPIQIPKENTTGEIPKIEAGTKKRGFTQTMQDSQYTSPEVKKLIQDANYTPQPNDVLIKEATRQIKTNIDEAKAKALSGEDNQSVANAMELIKHYQNAGEHDQAAEIAKAVAEKLTEHGRAIQAASLYNKLTPEGIVRYAQKEAGKNGIELSVKQSEELFKMAQDAGSAVGEEKAIKTYQMLARVQEFMPSKFVDQAVTVWKAGLLSNPTTHLRNIVGTGGMTGLETLSNAVAVPLDKIASTFTGTRTKALPSLGSLLEGGVQGGKKALTFLKTGADVDNALGKIDYKQVNLPPVLKQYANGIFRALGAEDKVFKEALLKKSLHEQSVVSGMNLGLKGSQLESHVKELYNNPTADMVKIATQEAEYGTFNGANAMSTALNKLKSSDSGATRGAAEFIMPFGKTPANVSGRIWDYSPGGFLKAGVNAANGKGQRQVVEDLSRAITGTGIMAGGYGLGKAGMMTGNYPVDPTQRAMWDAQNLQPNALKLGGRTYSTNALSPVGNLLGMGSGIAGLQGQVKPEQYPAAVAALGGQTLVNQTFLQGLSGALNALTDPARSAGTWANSAAAGVVPSIVGAATKAIDPTMRQTNGMMDAVQAKIPFLSQGLMPKQDVFGQPRMNNDASLSGRLGQFYNPFTPKDVKSSPVIDEIQRLDQSGSSVSLAHPSKQVSVAGYKVGLTPEEFTKLEKQTGGVIGNMLQKVISQPDYQNASDYDRANVINKVINAVRQSWSLQNIGSLKNSREQIQKQVQAKTNLRTPYFTK